VIRSLSFRLRVTEERSVVDGIYILDTTSRLETRAHMSFAWMVEFQEPTAVRTKPAWGSQRKKDSSLLPSLFASSTRNSTGALDQAQPEAKLVES